MILPHHFNCSIVAMLVLAPPLLARVDSTIAEPLVKAIGEICVKESPSAKDYARIADKTIDYGRRMLQAKSHPAEAVVDTGLDSVEIGERLDPRAADWTKLRQELASLRNTKDQQSPPQPKEESNKQHQDQDKKENQAGTDQEQHQSSQSSQEGSSDGGRNQKETQGSQSQNREPAEDQSNAKGEPHTKSEDSRNQREAGGSAFGDMTDKKENESQTFPDAQSDPSESQKVGGQAARKASNFGNEDPELVIPLQKLDQLRNLDSPAKLFRMIEGQSELPAGKKGKDW
ncbi:MAG: hypothetical protein HS122_03945 [Opitutaceae bacterium]|nr:hypothetical protein [Opitutaceae bacterium]